MAHKQLATRNYCAVLLF